MKKFLATASLAIMMAGPGSAQVISDVELACGATGSAAECEAAVATYIAQSRVLTPEARQVAVRQLATSLRAQREQIPSAVIVSVAAAVTTEVTEVFGAASGDVAQADAIEIVVEVASRVSAGEVEAPEGSVAREVLSRSQG
ncbi:MAG: hypothetical protein AAF092_08670 [Pseudomonadota bacterium]